jgi:hypothetical protein
MELMAPRDGLDQTAWLALVIDVPRGSPDRPGDYRSYGHRECRAMIRKLKI